MLCKHTPTRQAMTSTCILPCKLRQGACPDTDRHKRTAAQGYEPCLQPNMTPSARSSCSVRKQTMQPVVIHRHKSSCSTCSLLNSTLLGLYSGHTVAACVSAHRLQFLLKQQLWSCWTCGDTQTSAVRHLWLAAYTGCT